MLVNNDGVALTMGLDVANKGVEIGPFHKRK